MENHEATLDEVRARISACADESALRAIEREYLGKQGIVAAQLAAIPTLPGDQRKDAGLRANRLKAAVLEALAARGAELEAARLRAERGGAGFDPTLPPPKQERGSLHPITLVAREVED